MDIAKVINIKQKHNNGMTNRHKLEPEDIKHNFLGRITSIGHNSLV